MPSEYNRVTAPGGEAHTPEGDPGHVCTHTVLRAPRAAQSPNCSSRGVAAAAQPTAALTPPSLITPHWCNGPDKGRSPGRGGR